MIYVVLYEFRKTLRKEEQEIVGRVIAGKSRLIFLKQGVRCKKCVRGGGLVCGGMRRLKTNATPQKG